MSSALNSSVQSLTTRQSWGWWWPLLLLLGLAGLLLWQFRDKNEDDDYKGPPPEVTGRYYLQDPYLVIDAPVTPWTTHVGTADDASTRLKLKKGASTFYKDFWITAISKPTRDVIDRVQFWTVVKPGGDNTARNKALKAFNDLNFNLFSVNESRVRKVAKVTAHTPAVGEPPRLVDLINERRIPLAVPDNIGKLSEGAVGRPGDIKDWPKTFNFNTQVNVVDVPLPESEAPVKVWRVTFTPPVTLAGQAPVTASVTRFVLGEDGEPKPIPPDDYTSTSADFEWDEIAANIFEVKFKRGAYDVGEDTVSTCPNSSYEAFMADPDCKKLLCAMNKKAIGCPLTQQNARRAQPAYGVQKSAQKKRKQSGSVPKPQLKKTPGPAAYTKPTKGYNIGAKW